MRVVSLGYFIDNIIECLNIASEGEEVVVNVNDNKKLHITLEQKHSNFGSNNYHNYEDPRCNFSPR